MSKLIINKKEYSSRLILGTGKYKDFEETKLSVESSGCEMVTVAIRRMNIGQDLNSKNLLDSCISYFSKSLDSNPNQYTPNYDLGILYHNLGVDIILEELDIDADLEMVILMQEQAVEYFSKSLPYLEKVYQMKPEETSIVQGIAAVYYSLNDMEKHVEYMNILKGLESKSSGDN